ncbi:DUF5691 domain-containing protein [Lentzea sp. NPDC006480]|uniref:DUF5691 domain-containing protein n=1 Tax=Lentzea sp. NPDC006480 TaxID=3157176 RepID=UPI0033B6A780
MKAEWSKTVQELLIGTARGGGSPTDLLSSCAALGVAAFGATLPREVEAEPLAPAPPELALLPRPAARAVLEAIMSVDDEVLLTEWCALAKANNVVAEHRVLPALLALGTARPGLRAAVVEVLGTRGRWLASTRPGWSWASGTTPLVDEVPLAEILDLPSAQRVRALRRKRKSDPRGVGAFIAAEFDDSRRSADRQVLISALETALGPADEELLETALDDRASAVHDEALRLLRKLPTSALSARAAARLTAGLRLTADGFDVRTDELWTTQPDPDEQRDLMRDGSEKGVAGRIRAAAASVPPSYWTARLETDDRGAAEVLRRGPWAGALLRGIADQLAAATDPRPWAVAAAETLTGMEQLEMLAALPASVAEQAVVAVSVNWHYDLLDHACAQLPAPWSPETTRALLHRYAALPDPRWRTGRPPAVLLARGNADLLGANWEGLTRRWPENSLELEVLRLRIRLRESFAPPAPASPEPAPPDTSAATGQMPADATPTGPAANASAGPAAAEPPASAEPPGSTPPPLPAADPASDTD